MTTPGRSITQNIEFKRVTRQSEEDGPKSEVHVSRKAVVELETCKYASTRVNIRYL